MYHCSERRYKTPPKLQDEYIITDTQTAALFSSCKRKGGCSLGISDEVPILQFALCGSDLLHVCQYDAPSNAAAHMQSTGLFCFHHGMEQCSIQCKHKIRLRLSTHPLNSSLCIELDSITLEKSLVTMLHPFTQGPRKKCKLPIPAARPLGKYTWRFSHTSPPRHNKSPWLLHCFSPLCFQGGCIIRAGFLDRIKQAYQRDPKLPSLLVDPPFAQVGGEGGASSKGPSSRLAIVSRI